MRILQRQFNDVFDFTESLINENKKNFSTLLEFVSEFDKIHTQEEKKLPYHINLIDELHADENAHSRILGKLLQQKSAKSTHFEILESFLNFITENHRIKEDFRQITINKPVITQEIGRIDLWIRDEEYAIIIENKIGWAKDQPNQLERYIKRTKEQDFDEQQIYVLYLPPIYDKEPNEQAWGKYLDNDIRKKRYLNLSFKNDILPWLKENLLPNIRPNDKFLSSAIEQYIDHLEGKFNLRGINNKMNMELQKFIREKLKINDIEPEKAFEIVSEKVQEIENVLLQLESLQEKIQDEIDEKFFSMCHTELKNLNLNVVRVIENYPEYNKKSVGVKLDNKLTVWIGKEDGLEGEFFCQVNSNGNSKTLTRKAKQIFREILKNEIVQEDKDGFQIYSYLSDRDKALTYLKEYCRETTEMEYPNS